MGFGNSSSDAAGSSSAVGSSSSLGSADEELSDYARLDDGRHRTSILFVEADCAFVAPLAVAASEMIHPTMLRASMASSSAVAPLHPLLERVLEERVRLPSVALARKPLSSIQPSARLDWVVSFDEASRVAADTWVASASAAGAVAAGKLRRIHQDFGAGLAADASWVQADALGLKIKEFVSELPDLLSMM